MSREIPHFILLEPYFGGSHRVFLNGLQKHVPFTFTLVSLPARKWKMRMQLAAPWMAEKVIAYIRAGKRCDAILCSTFLDLATLKSLLCRGGIHLPLLIYFHENQFAYPNRPLDPAEYQFSALNLTSALAADGLAFNSQYNLDTFIRGAASYLKKAVDMEVVHLLDTLSQKAEVLYPGIDFSRIDSLEKKAVSGPPVIVWNHRWEHDKDPETFFQVLYALAERDIDFQLIVLGQSFSRRPAVFSQARKKLKKHVLHFGYTEDRLDYVRLLRRGNIVVSTAIHEFFGMAVLEGVRSGCTPVVPDRLAYRELFPRKYRYREGTLQSFMAEKLADFKPMPEKERIRLTEKFSWPARAELFASWLRAFC